MLNSNLNSLNLYNNNYYSYSPSFCSKTGNTPTTSEVGKLNSAEKDEFVSEEEKRRKKIKKGAKRSVVIGATAAALSLGVVILNPRFSSKVITKLKDLSIKMNKKMKENKDRVIAGKFYKKLSGFYDWSSRAITSINNVNSVKDTYFKRLCCEEKSFSNIRDKNKRNFMLKADSIIRKILKKPHELITKWGDNLAKTTVKSSYKKSLAKAKDLDEIIVQLKNKLSSEDQIILDNMLYKIKQNKSYMSDDKILERLLEQEKLMGCLNGDIRKYFQRFQHGFRNHHIKKSTHINNNLSFWAEDMLRADKENIIKNGNDFVNTILGKNKGEASGYKEVIDFLSSKIDKKEIAQLNKHYGKFEKQLIKANKNECIEYFDKKRDLILGSAPTDIVTGSLLLGLSGIHVAAADDKEQKISRVITGVIPTAAGVLVSIAMTSLLYSGTQCIILGGLSSLVLNRIATALNNMRLKAKGKSDQEIEQIEGFE